jgi:hypothetical protein
MDKGQPFLLRPTAAIARNAVDFEDGGGSDAGAVAHVDLETADPTDLLRKLHAILDPPKRFFGMPPHDTPDRRRDAQAIPRLRHRTTVSIEASVPDALSSNTHPRE